MFRSSIKTLRIAGWFDVAKVFAEFIWSGLVLSGYIHTRAASLGVIRRVASKGGARAAVYVLADAEIPTPPPARTLADWLAELLSVRPMTELELTLALLEAGYDGSKSRQTLRKSAGATLRKNGDPFKRDGEGWANQNKSF